MAKVHTCITNVSNVSRLIRYMTSITWLIVLSCKFDKNLLHIRELYSGAGIMRTSSRMYKLSKHQTNKVNEKHTVVWITIVWIKQNVWIIQGSHYPSSTVITHLLSCIKGVVSLTSENWTKLSRFPQHLENQGKWQQVFISWNFRIFWNIMEKWRFPWKICKLYNNQCTQTHRYCVPPKFSASHCFAYYFLSLQRKYRSLHGSCT